MHEQTYKPLNDPYNLPLYDPYNYSGLAARFKTTPYIK